MTKVKPPSPRPCESCPYRRDVPSGVWAESEYIKLVGYDKPTGDQPTALFLCHQTDADSDHARLCGGWVGCHDMEENLAVRIAALFGTLTPEDAESLLDYVSPVPLFDTAKEAAAHGMRMLYEPDSTAKKVIDKIVRNRTDLQN